MSTLGVDKVREYEYSGEDLFNDLPIIANDIVYEGAAVGENGSGYVRPLVAADPFVGFAVRNVDNTGGQAGDANVHVRSKGLVKLTVAGLDAPANGNDGTPVYASDDDTFTLTSTSNTLIGRTHRYVASGVGIVYFEANSIQV